MFMASSNLYSLIPYLTLLSVLCVGMLEVSAQVFLTSTPESADIFETSSQSSVFIGETAATTSALITGQMTVLISSKIA